MNKNNPHPKLKPYFPVNTQIFGKHSYYKFLKNRPKYLQKLKVERYDHIDDNVKSRRVMGIHIKRLTKSTKSVENLDFTEFPHEVIPLNVAQDIIKRFNRIRGLSMIGSSDDDSADKKLIFLAYLYLKSLKNLRSLALEFSSSPDAERILSKFFVFLQHTKLEKIEYRLESKEAPLSRILNFPRYPSSIKSWSLSCSEDPNLGNVDNVCYLMDLKKLQNLKRFQLQAPLNADLLNQVLETIPQPENLKTLAFQVAQNQNITRTLLTKYQGLEYFAMKSEQWIDLFSSNSWSLKGLCVEVQNLCKENLGSLKESLIQQQATLENLNIKLRFQEEPETFLDEMCDFLGEIGNLKKLKTLRIALIVKAKGRNDSWWSSQLEVGDKEVNSLKILPLLTSVINQLKELKELGLSYAGASFENDFEAFFQALLLKSHTLQTLEVNLAGYKIQKRDLEVLVKTLPQLKALETLKIRNLVINDPSFFNCFAEMIHRCSSLNRLAFSDVKVEVAEYNPQEILEMFKRIFQKQNLAHIEFLDGGDTQKYESCERLRLGQIYKECPHIHNLILPLQTYHFDFPSKWKGV